MRAGVGLRAGVLPEADSPHPLLRWDKRDHAGQELLERLPGQPKQLLQRFVDEHARPPDARERRALWKQLPEVPPLVSRGAPACMGLAAAAALPWPTAAALGRPARTCTALDLQPGLACSCSPALRVSIH